MARKAADVAFTLIVQAILVAFLGDGYFAYSDVEGTRSRTRVLRITDEPAMGPSLPLR